MKKAIFTENKHLVKGKFLIDDNPRIVDAKGASWEPVLVESD